MRWVLLVFVSFSLGLAAVPAARAWDAPGHAAIGALAYAYLLPGVRATVDRLAGELPAPAGTYNGATMACWMDDLRGKNSPGPYQGKFFPWHYVDFGLHDDDPAPALQPGPDDENGGNLVTGFARALAVLRGGRDPLVGSRAVACAIVMHLVGDAHQPLHGGTEWYRDDAGQWRNDRGGNLVRITNAPAEEPHYNLHYFWDAAYRTSVGADGRTLVVDGQYGSWKEHDPETLRPLVEALSREPLPPGLNVETDVVRWAQESNALDRAFVYPRLRWALHRHAAELSPEYVTEAHRIARERMVAAGYRLAHLLNEVLGGG